MVALNRGGGYKQLASTTGRQCCVITSGTNRSVIVDEMVVYRATEPSRSRCMTSVLSWVNATKICGQRITVQRWRNASTCWRKRRRRHSTSVRTTSLLLELIIALYSIQDKYSVQFSPVPSLQLFSEKSVYDSSLTCIGWCACRV